MRPCHVNTEHMPGSESKQMVRAIASGERDLGADSAGDEAHCEIFVLLVSSSVTSSYPGA